MAVFCSSFCEIQLFPFKHSPNILSYSTRSSISQPPHLRFLSRHTPRVPSVSSRPFLCSLRVASHAALAKITQLTLVKIRVLELLLDTFRYS